MASIRLKYLGALAAVAIVGLLPLRAAIYHHPLSSTETRDAYFLGTEAEQSASFLTPYVRAFSPAGPVGAYVSQMEVRTPYAQVVQNSRLHSINYSAQQAEDDYLKDPNMVQVRVQILYPVTAPAPILPPQGCNGVHRMDDAFQCFQGFSFSFRQSKELYAGETYGTPIYSDSFIGGDVWFSFPAKQVASAPLRITVTNPAGDKVSATFDLAALR